jgi:hypothetical protein
MALFTLSSDYGFQNQANQTYTVTGGTGLGYSLSAGTITSQGSNTFTATLPASQMVTVTDSGGNTGTIASLIPFSDSSNCFWFCDGRPGSTLGVGLNWDLVSGQYACAPVPGSYFWAKVNLPGTATVTVYGKSNNLGGNIWFRSVCDNSPHVIVNYPNGEFKHVVGNNLATGNHQFFFMPITTDNSFTNLPAAMPTQIYGILAPGGSGVAPVVLPGTALWMGDSRVNGTALGFDYSFATGSHADPGFSPAIGVSSALGCEGCIYAYSGTGYVWAAGSLPGLYGNGTNGFWNMFCTGINKDFTKPTNLKYVIIRTGGNDVLAGQTAAQIQAAVNGFLGACRTAVGSSVRIAILSEMSTTIANATTGISDGGNAAIKAGVTQYLQSSGDPNAVFVNVNMSAIESAYTYSAGGPTYYALADGQHPIAFSYSLISAHYAQAIQAAFSPSAPSIGANAFNSGFLM